MADFDLNAPLVVAAPAAPSKEKGGFDLNAPLAIGDEPATPEAASKPPRKLLDNAPNDTDVDGILKGAGTTLVRGALGTVGQIGDTENFMNYLAQRARAWTTGKSLDQVKLDSAALRKKVDENAKGKWWNVPTKLGSGTLVPSTDELSSLTPLGEYTPQSAAGRTAMAVGEGAITSLSPYGMVGAAKGATTAMANAAARGIVKTAPAAGAGAGVGSLVTEATGEPLWGVVAGLGTGVGVGAATSAANQTGHRLTGAGKQKLADERVARVFDEDRSGNMQRLVNRQHNDQTAGQATMSPDALFIEREAAQLDPTFRATKSNIDARANDRARAQLDTVAPTSGNPEAVFETFRRQRAALEAAHDQQIATAQGQLPRTPDARPPEEIGANLRTGPQAIDSGMGANVSHLYKTLDPDNKLDLAFRPVHEAAQVLRSSLRPGYNEIPAVVTTQLNKIDAMPMVGKFNDIAAFESQLTNDIAVANRAGEYNTARMLGDLKTAVRSTVDDAAQEKIRFESEAVRHGTIPEEQTFAANLQRALEEYRERQAGLAVGDGTRARGADAGEPPGVAPVVGRAGETGEGSGTGPGSRGVQGLEPNLDAETGQRLRQAQQAHKQRADMYRDGIGADLIGRDERGKYTVMDSVLPGRVFPAGPTGFEVTRRALEAGADRPGMINAVEDAALLSLRKRMGSEPLTSEILDRWSRDHSHALRALDDVGSDFRTRFGTVAQATDNLNAATAARQAAIEAFEEGAARRFLGLNSVEEVRSAAGQMISSPTSFTQVRDALQQLGHNSPGADGLRRAGVEWLFGKTANAGVANGEHLMSGHKLGKLVRDRDQTFQELYGPDGAGRLRALADEFDLGAEQARIAGLPGSPTASMLASTIKNAAGQRPDISWAAIVTLSGGLKNALMGAGVKLSSELWHRISSNSAEQVNRLFLDAMADPRRTEAALARAFTPSGEPNLTALSVLMVDPGNASAHTADELDLKKAPGNNWPAAGEGLTINMTPKPRAAGGRAGIDHAARAQQLVRQVDVIRKQHAGGTKAFLDLPDTHVAKALAIANERI